MLSSNSYKALQDRSDEETDLVESGKSSHSSEGISLHEPISNPLLFSSNHHHDDSSIQNQELTTGYQKLDDKSLDIDKSTMLVGLITFVGDSSRGILFPVLYTLCQRLGGTIVDLGYIVAMFSIGRLLATPPAGYLCDRYHHRIPLAVSSFILAIGAIIWANTFSTKSLLSLYLAQFVLGIGSGTLGLTRSYVVERVAPARRTEIIGLLTALQYAGFTMSPILGSGISSLGNMTSEYWKFALPGYLIALLAFICFIGLITFFENLPKQDKATRPIISQTSEASDESKTSETEANVKERKEKNTILFLILSMIMLNVTTKGSIAVFETLGAEILIDDYNFTIFAVGVLISIAGSIGTFHLVMFKSFWTKYFNDIELMLGGIALMIIAQLILLSYGSIPSLYRYIAGVMIMYGFGYPIGHTAVIGAFSKIQKSGPQAALMSWFATAGSIARVVLPIGSGYLDNAVDNAPFCIVLFFLSLSYVSIIILKPLIIFYTQGNVEKCEILPSMWSEKRATEWFQVISMVFAACFALVALMFLAPVPVV